MTISDRMDTTKELVCIYFILISRIVSLSYKTYPYIEERDDRESREETGEDAEEDEHKIRTKYKKE